MLGGWHPLRTFHSYTFKTAIAWTPVVCFAFLLLALKQSCAAFSRFAFLIFAKLSASALSANITADGMLCIPPTGTQTILQAQTIRTVVLALLVPLVHSQDNTCVTASIYFAHQNCDKSRLLFKRKQPPLLQGRLS